MKFDFNAEYFNPEHVLECGQIFRFKPFKQGYFVCSADKACYVHSDGVKTVVESEDSDYFYNYFDLARDYSQIVNRAKERGVPLLTRSSEAYKGLRLLNQNHEETLYSFIISQNNNIPRIKGIISRVFGRAIPHLPFHARACRRRKRIFPFRRLRLPRRFSSGNFGKNCRGRHISS